MFGHIKKVIIIVLVVFIIYAGVQFGIPFYRYYAFKTDASDMVDFQIRGLEKDRIEKLRDKVFEKAESLGLPVTRDQIKIEATETGYWMYVGWKETVDILGQYQKTFEFEVEASS